MAGMVLWTWDSHCGARDMEAPIDKGRDKVGEPLKERGEGKEYVVVGTKDVAATYRYAPIE